MATSTGSQAVQRGACTFQREMRCYSHRENSSNFTANLYLTSDGEVSYHSQQISTAWHGHWNLHHHDHKMVIQFSDEGDVTNLDTLVVFLCMGNADGTDAVGIPEAAADAQELRSRDHLRCDEFCSSPGELSEARLRLYG